MLGIQSGTLKLDDFTRVFNMASDTLENVIAGRAGELLLARPGRRASPAKPSELRGFIEVQPVLDFSGDRGRPRRDRRDPPGGRRNRPEISRRRVRLTGPVAMADEEFATIKEGAVRNGIITVDHRARSSCGSRCAPARLIVAVFVNLFIGLALTAALGLLMVGTLNLISVYFAVLFVGIGVDFGIQYSVRYRAERHELDDLKGAVLQAGKFVGAPLTLAAGATAAGFLSFLPTDYRGVSELGLIAGSGMLIAFATSITVLPALIRLLNPPGEPDQLGFSFAGAGRQLSRAAAHPDHRRHGDRRDRRPAAALLAAFRFQPDQSARSAFGIDRDLSRSQPRPRTPIANAVEVLAPSLGDAGRDRRAAVEAAGSLARHDAGELHPRSPAGEAAAHSMTRQRSSRDAFDPKNAMPPPTDAENVDALKEGAEPADRSRRRSERLRAPARPSGSPRRSPARRRRARSCAARPRQRSSSR